MRNSAAWDNFSRLLESDFALLPRQIHGPGDRYWFRTTRQHLRCSAVPSRHSLNAGDRPLMSKPTESQVTEILASSGGTQVFRPYERLVEIKILGKTFQVPEKNTILRCFQYISPETIPYGRFCWNQDCQYCRVTCQLPDDDEPREMISCKFIVMPGMEVTELSQELKWCLRAKLPADTTVNS